MVKKILLILGVVAAGIWALNSSRFASPTGDTRLIAHRGVHHIYAGNDRSANTCRAAQIEPLTHDYIENTLPSMQAAFAYGADVVELDVHLTTDGQFAVFHDWTLDCQTDGTGVTHKHDMAALRALDLGYGLTADGDTYPLRGAGISLMPTLTEVLEAGLPGPVLVNFKSDRASEGKALASLLQDNALRANVFAVYGGAAPTRIAQEIGLIGFDRKALVKCLASYVALGWSSYVPPACRDRLIAVPMNVGPWLWGWPHKFTRRMAREGTPVILWGPYDGSGFSSGVDDAETLARVPKGFDGYVWTNRIEVIGPLVKE